MALTMHALVIPALERTLTNLSAILAKGAAHAEAQGQHPDTLVELRLAPDMYTLAGQVQRASDSSKGLAGRLAGIEIPSFADDETTMAQLQDRIARTLAFVRSATPAQLDGSEARPIELKLPSTTLHFTGQAYAFGFALPNIYFHVVTAYDILRHHGVPLSKLDYLGAAS